MCINVCNRFDLAGMIQQPEIKLKKTARPLIVQLWALKLALPLFYLAHTDQLFQCAGQDPPRFTSDHVGLHWRNVTGALDLQIGY